MKLLSSEKLMLRWIKILRNTWIKTNSNTDLSPEFVHTKFLCLLRTRTTWFTRSAPRHNLKNGTHYFKKINYNLTNWLLYRFLPAIFFVDHRQINHQLDKKIKRSKQKSCFRAIILKISRQKFAPVINSSGFQHNNMRASLPGKLWIFWLYFVVEKTGTAMSL